MSAANEGKIVTAIVVLRVEYPPTYPDIAPTLDLTIDPSSPPSSLSFPDDKDTLLDALAPVVEENLGMEMIFTLTTTLKEAAEEILLTRAQEKENAREEKIRREEEKEMEKFRGNLVTRERFIQWRENFLAEMEEKKRREKEKEDEEKSKRGGGGGGGGGASLKEKRMTGTVFGMHYGHARANGHTGRELYEKGLVGAADEEDTEADGEVVDVGKLKIQA